MTPDSEFSRCHQSWLFTATLNKAGPLTLGRSMDFTYILIGNPKPIPNLQGMTPPQHRTNQYKQSAYKSSPQQPSQRTKLYFKMHQIARRPSRQPIFLPSA